MNRIDLLKKLLPGFLPLIIFIIADEIWGTKTGLVIAVVFGIGELGFTWFREKRFDKFIVADTGLLVVMGGISFLLDNAIFFKLKPALIELIFCIILGISVFSGKNIIMLMTRRYLKNIILPEEAKRKMDQSLKVMFWIFCLHTLLIVYSAFYMSEKAWGFISGVLFYILFGIYMIFEFIKTRLKRSSVMNEEWLPVVDEEGNIRGKAPRPAVHNGSKILHPVVHLHLVNSRNEIFLQKRKMDKLVQPGKWDTAVGGHISYGEDLETSLRREAEEETGITDLIPQFLKKYTWESELEKELVFVFVAKYDQPVQVSHDEIDEGRFWKMSEIKKSLGKNLLTPNFEYEFRNFFMK